MDFFDATESKRDSRVYKEQREALIDPLPSTRAIDPWRYIPSQEHLELIKKRREERFNREGKSKSGAMAEVARFPVEIHLEMSRIYGNDWVNKPGILPEFLRKNPQYRVGSPMDGLAGLGEIVAKTSDPTYKIVETEEDVPRETMDTEKMVEEAVKKYVEEPKENAQVEGFKPEEAKVVTSYDKGATDAAVLDASNQLQ